MRFVGRNAFPYAMVVECPMCLYDQPPPTTPLVSWHQTLARGTLGRVLSTSKRLRNQARPGQILEMPFRRRLRLPSPENPATVTLISIKLSLDIILKVRFVNFEHPVNRALELLLTISVITLRCGWESAIVASTFAETVKPASTVSLSASPFAYYCPLVCVSYLCY